MPIRLPPINTHKFDSLLVVDEERGLAVLDDISIVVQNLSSASPGKNRPLLEEDGNFHYEVKFFINTVLCSEVGINEVLINVHKERPAPPGTAFASSSREPKALMKDVLNRKGNGSKSPVDSRNFSQENKPASIIASDRISLPVANSTKIENPNKKVGNPVLDPATTETRRNRAGAGGSSQRFVVQMAKPQNQKDVEQSSMSYLSATSESPVGFLNSNIRNYVANNKSSLEDEIPRRNFKYISETFLSAGVHPAEALESFYPQNAISGPTALGIDEDVSRESLRGVREPVLQPGASSVEEEVFERQFANRRASSHKSSRTNQTENFLKNSTLLQSSTADLLSHMVSFNKNALETPFSTALEGSFYSDFLAIFKKIAVNIKKSSSRPRLFFEVKLLSTEIPDLNRSKIFVIDHESQLREFTVPDKKPVLNLVSQTIGKNTLSVKQEDEFSPSILVERRVVRPGENYPLPYEVIQKIDLTHRDQSFKIEDSVDNQGRGKCIYRATSIGPFNQSPINVKYLIVPDMSLPKDVGSSLSSTKGKNAFTAKSRSDGVLLSLSNYPEDAQYFYINKIPYNSPSALNQIPLTVDLDSAGSMIKSLRGVRETVSVLDRDVFENRIYTYVCQIKLPFGDTLATTPADIRFVRANRQVPFNVNIKNLSVSDTSNENLNVGNPNAGIENFGSSVKFDIDIEASDSGIEDIVLLLTDSGVNDSFLEDLKRDRSRISSLAFTEVVRVNLKTGKSESFGRNNLRKFEDIPSVRNSLGISQINKGDRFEYIVHLYLLSPESIFRSALTQSGERSSTDLKKIESDIKVLSQKFAKSYTGSNDLPSEAELLDNSTGRLKTQIERGRTGVTESVSVQFLPSTITLSSVSSRRTSLGQNEVSWRILSGDPAIVDYYVIYALYQGVNQPIGTIVHKGAYAINFYDRRYAGVVGNVSYTVEAILLDGSRIQSPSPSVQNRAQSMPRSLINAIAGKESTSNFKYDTPEGVDPRIVRQRVDR